MAYHNQPELSSLQPSLPGLEDITTFAQAPQPVAKLDLPHAVIASQIRYAYERATSNSEKTEEVIDLDDDPRYRALTDAAGFSVANARAALTGKADMPTPAFYEPSEAQKIADDIMHAASKARSASPHKPRGRSFPQDESRADIDFNPNPTPEELQAIRAGRTPGDTYSGEGLRTARRTIAALAHDIVRRETEGLPERDRMAIELARLARRNQAS